ncbi:MAG: hypothetical protein JNL83_00010 [Myxococcales bacterium]|nr:hypothetical protein [Myxococcales bacterium]
MTPLPSTTRSTRNEIGRLCLAGDHACAAGDLAALREIAHELADFTPEPLHCELARLAAACAADPARAIATWDEVKACLYREVGA